MGTRDLVGSPNETEVIVNDIQTKALLDTGSTVSTVSEKFYNSNLSDLTMHLLEFILKIECADGQHLPYLGANGIKQPCLLLVVPDSTYNLNVPLLGTNVLSTFMEECRHRHGSRFLQRKARYQGVWISASCRTRLPCRCMHSSTNVDKTLVPM